MRDSSDLERLAEELRRLADLEEHENVLATTMATRVLGPAGITVDRELKGPAYLRRRTDGGYQVVIRPDLNDVRFAIAHELGHFAIQTIACAKMDHESEERAANYLAAAMLAPARMIRRVHKYFGESLSEIAQTFGLSQTSTVLRLSEVTGDERAVVTRHDHVIARGGSWVTVPVVDVARGRMPWRGLAKAHLRGGIDEGRIALRKK